eukprot:TRINITY_DN1872_c0_g1_i1.p1 TRINITY_DN1872_c0_g1~~TRINITY_DN1872_c0_g1_i1.p1  ORF type:complete len:323 (-),score=118.03 TRINITY_DN1872_c0_g1_i1:755-1723(-)
MSDEKHHHRHHHKHDSDEVAAAESPSSSESEKKSTSSSEPEEVRWEEPGKEKKKEDDDEEEEVHWEEPKDKEKETDSEDAADKLAPTKVEAEKENKKHKKHKEKEEPAVATATSTSRDRASSQGSRASAEGDLRVKSVVPKLHAALCNENVTGKAATKALGAFCDIADEAKPVSAAAAVSAACSEQVEPIATALIKLLDDDEASAEALRCLAFFTRIPAAQMVFVRSDGHKYVLKQLDSGSTDGDPPTSALYCLRILANLFSAVKEQAVQKAVHNASVAQAGTKLMQNFPKSVPAQECCLSIIANLMLVEGAVRRFVATNNL